jgi:chitin synthase
VLPDGHQKIGSWLTEVGVNEHFLSSKFVQHGYDDTTFLVGVDEAELLRIGIPQTLTGRAHIRMMLDAIVRLPRNVLPENIPQSVGEWLNAISLGFYTPHFERCGYRGSDLHLCEGLTEADLNQLGIRKRAHRTKCMTAIRKLNKLLEQGRSPEAKSLAQIEQGETREMVSRLPEISLEGTIFLSRMVLVDEESFWTQLVGEVLDPKQDSIANVAGLKQSLAKLRNVSVTVLFLLNMTWVSIMLELSGARTKSLHVLHTSPLGLLFLFVYGSIFMVQFSAMLWHRFGTMVQYFASVPFPARSGNSPQNRYAEIKPQ